MQNSSFYRYASVIFVNLIWAGGYPATTLALNQVSPTLLTVLRLGMGTLVMLPFLKLKNGARWTRQLIVQSFLIGAIGFALPVFLSTVGLAKSDAAVASVAVAIEPLFTIILGAIVFRSKIPGRQWIAFAIAIIGTWVIAGCPRPGNAGYLLGDILLLLSVLCYAYYSVFVLRLTRSISVTAATASTMLGGFLASIPLYLIYPQTTPHTFHWLGWLAVAYIAIAGTAFAYFVWIVVLQSVSITIAAISLYLQPIFGVIFSFLVLHVQLSLLFYIGSIIVLVAVAVGTNFVKAEPDSHLPI